MTMHIGRNFIPRPCSHAFRRAAIPLLFACIASLAFAAQSSIPTTVAISGKVTSGSGTHAIYVALWDANGFLQHPVQRIRIDPGAAAVFHFQVPPGRWSLSAFEDENGNGVLDEGAFGPKEPFGFWLPFHGWRKPRFDDVAFQLDRDTTGVQIQLHK
jgi:uncharacterized protein (DUF2141 family)